MKEKRKIFDKKSQIVSADVDGQDRDKRQ